MSVTTISIPEPNNGVIESPDGEIQYFTKINNKRNPYINSEIESEDPDFVNILINNEILRIRRADYERALELERKAMLIRLICIIDLFNNILFPTVKSSDTLKFLFNHTLSPIDNVLSTSKCLSICK